MIIDLAVGKDGEVLDSQSAKKGSGDRGAWEGTKTSYGVSMSMARPREPSTMGLVRSVPHRQIRTLSKP